MITEIVEFEVKPGTADKFMQGVKASEEVFKKAEGFLRLELHHQIENPLIFVLLIQWETVAYHMDVFRNSPAFASWRANVGEYFAGPPRLQHSETKLSY